MSAIVRLEPGTVFATDFRVVAPLREGGMGTVYVVDQISTGARRALKLMHPQMVADETMRRRFEREARISARIESDHVVQVVGAGIDAASSTPWLAMELLAGTDLGDYVEAKGPVTPQTLLLIFEQLCHALTAAHRMGVVHRDLKPENIFLAKSRSSGTAFTLKVLDFGIAKIAVDTTASHTAAVGTPMWMAPEQTSPGLAVAPQTDIWALGLIAFWLLTGRSFWRAGNAESPSMAMFLREILVDEIVPASARAASFGCGVSLRPEFDAWFARCVHREPEARYATVVEAHEELIRALGQDAGTRKMTTGPDASTWAQSLTEASSQQSTPMAMTAAPVTSPPPSAALASPVTQRRRAIHSAVGAGAALAALGVAGFFVLRRAPAAQPEPPLPSPVSASVGPMGGTVAPPPVDTVLLPAQTVGAGAAREPAIAPSASSSSPAPKAGAIVEVNGGAAPAEPSSRGLPAAAKVAAAPSPGPGLAAAPSPGPGPGRGGDPQQAFAEINKVVRSHLPAIKRQCWEPAFAARQSDAPSKAKVTLSLNIAPDGTVQSADAAGGDGFSGLAACVQSQAMKLRFAPSSGGAVVSVPFVFAAQ